MDIKPIETHYNGYRFRSRLEARWAVFFDAVGIEYEYEKEGFEINKCWEKEKTWYYLPDFYLPKTKTWVEIKGSVENISDSYWYMLACAVDWGGCLPDVEDSEGTERGLVCLFGVPCDEGCKSYPIIQHRKGGRCNAIKFSKNGIEYEDIYDTYFDASWGEDAGKEIKKHCERVMSLGCSDNFYNVKIAAEKARSARFEHGENSVVH